MANTADRVERPLRLPRALYAKVKKIATRNNRSANAEILVAIERHVHDQTSGKDPDDRR